MNEPITTRIEHAAADTGVFIALVSVIALLFAKEHQTIAADVLDAGRHTGIIVAVVAVVTSLDGRISDTITADIETTRRKTGVGGVGVAVVTLLAFRMNNAITTARDAAGCTVIGHVAVSVVAFFVGVENSVAAPLRQITAHTPLSPTARISRTVRIGETSQRAPGQVDIAGEARRQGEDQPQNEKSETHTAR